MNSKRLKYTLLTAILVAVVLLVSVVPVAMAKPDTAENQAKPLDGVAVEKMIERLEPYVMRCDDGTFRLDIPKNAKINKTSPEFKAILAGMNFTNELVREGKLVTTSDLTVNGVDDSQFVLQTGRSEIKPRWYGFEVWFSHETCQAIFVAGASVGAITLLLTAEFPHWVGKVIFGALAVFCAANVAIFDKYDEGCGIHMKFVNPNPVTLWLPFPFYIKSQTC